MKNRKQQILNILAEIEGWNNGDRETFILQGDGTVPFDGTGCFAARQKKINELRKLAKEISE